MSVYYYKSTYHIVFSTKFRRKWLSGELYKQAHTAIRDSLKQDGAFFALTGGVEDHVHILLKINTTGEIENVVKRAKYRAAKSIREIERRFAWQSGGYISTVSPSDHESLVRYILRQPEHHERGTLLAELELPDSLEERLKLFT